MNILFHVHKSKHLIWKYILKMWLQHFEMWCVVAYACANFKWNMFTLLELTPVYLGITRSIPRQLIPWRRQAIDKHAVDCARWMGRYLPGGRNWTDCTDKVSYKIYCLCLSYEFSTSTVEPGSIDHICCHQTITEHCRHCAVFNSLRVDIAPYGVVSQYSEWRVKEWRQLKMDHLTIDHWLVMSVN